MTQFGIVLTAASARQVVDYARTAEAAGFDRAGISDTAPRLYHGTYPTITATLLGTERIAAGPYVTNPVTRHWSVHAANINALEELAPGRFFLGMAAGDGAVHSVGLKPAKLADFPPYLADLRAIAPDNLAVQLAFSGVKGVEMAGPLADELNIGTGLDAGALVQLGDRARATRRAAGVDRPIRIWAGASVFFARSEAEVPQLRREVAGLSVHGARFAFDISFEAKNVPDAWQPVIRERMTHYDFAYHGKLGVNPNGMLFDGTPALRDYIVDRFALIGTPDQCARRLEQVVRDADLDGVWLRVASIGDGPEGQTAAIRLAGEAFGLSAR